MLKLTLKPGEHINIGKNIRVIFSGGSANNVHLLVDAPKEIDIARSNVKNAVGTDGAETVRKKKPYYKEKGISEEARREIVEILKRENYGK